MPTLLNVTKILVHSICPSLAAQINGVKPAISVELTSEPNKYQTNYEWEQSQTFEKSRIKVIKPELIRQFAAAFREKLNTGLTRTQGVNTIPRVGPGGGAVSQTATPGVNAPASNAPTGGGGFSSGGGSGGY